VCAGEALWEAEKKQYWSSGSERCVLPVRRWLAETLPLKMACFGGTHNSSNTAQPAAKVTL